MSTRTTKVLLGAAAVLVVLLVIGGIMGAVSKKPSSSTGPAVPGAVYKTPYRTVAVSAPCLDAMQTAADHGVGIDVSDAQMALDSTATVTRCKSPDEWMTAVQAFQNSGDHAVVSGTNVDPYGVLQSFCDDNRLADVPAKAGACDGVPPHP